MGTVRLLLAVVVAITHTPASTISSASGLLPMQGAYAVECFFAISGFYMALTWHRKYAALPQGARVFWFARAARLFPAYWLVIIVTLVAAAFVSTVPVVSWFNGAPCLFSASDYAVLGFAGFTNLVMLGQEIPGFLHICGSYPISAIMPQGWSLGMEAAFYLLLPWLIGLRSRWLIVIALTAGATRLLADYTLPANPWQIRFTPFELYFFVLGILGYRASVSPRGTLVQRRAVGFAALAVLLALVLIGRWPVGFSEFPRASVSLVLGLIFAIGVPPVFSLTRQWHVDQWLGELSYPVYIWHTLMIGLVPAALVGPQGIVSHLATLAVAVLTVVAVDRPVERWRQARVRRTTERNRPDIPVPLEIRVQASA